MKKPEHKVLSVGDLHAPFMHRDAGDFLYEMNRKHRPTVTCLAGDEADMHALSYHDHDPDGLSAGDELKAAIKALKPLYQLFPRAYICESNHTSLIYRKAYSHGLAKAYIKEYRDFLEAPKGWMWAESFEFDNVLYEHGTGFSGQQGALKAAVQNMQSTVIGHLHAFAGIQYLANAKHLIYGFNVGCLIDKDAYAFSYGKNIKSKPVLGAGVIDRGVPTFVPMTLDTKGRWVGKL